MNLRLLLELTKRDFTEKYAGSILGLWWSFIWPLINIFIYTVIFSKVMGAKIQGIPSTYSYGLYLAAGLIPWTAFSNTILRASNIFIEKKNIITKIPISLLILPLSVALSECITFLISILIFIVVLFLLGISFSKIVFLVPLAYVLQQVFAYALGLLLATLNVFIRDIKEVVNITVQIWFWFTPIVYVVDILPEKVKELLYLNPVYAFIQVYQKAFVTKEQIDYTLLFIYGLISFLLLSLSYVVYKKLEKDIRDFL
ncbi:ABC-2 type transporter [Desulfurobacterium thermolithotrophum DSM 11699]|uniref:Transport permease protein n=1 Tax=Desulfurobacterium thermolithotrophum (strain DSM 11699 / BSA) TaxID=868864 RepID=F0S176_DESTD|nr:ABC transporter permease [Desulfurobacterium thermolithotrophum]ADY73954.1 ABC-2 type transporter [Desulfurobacterium thermolithotrophum DSM 11699]